MSTSPLSFKEIAPAMVKFQAEASNIAKDAKNPHFKSKYASLEATIEAIREGMAKCDLFFTQISEPSQNGGPAVLVTTIMHKSGEYLPASRMPLISPKQDMQGFGSAWSYARRYSLQGILGLAATDDDANEAVGLHKPAQERPAAMPAYRPPPHAQRVANALRKDREDLESARVNNDLQKQRHQANYPTAPPWPDEEPN